MANSPDAAAQKMIDNLPEKTGRSLDEWLKVLAATDLEKHGEIVKFLKSEHDVTHGFANLIAHRFRDSSNGGAPDDPVAAQYSGAKAGLKPIYDKLLETVQRFGTDIGVSPKKTYVSLRRSKQFALIQPSTKDRVDVGINLKGTKPGKRLEASGSFNAMVSHRVRLTSPDDVDSELETWLRKAYDAA
jgi:hypothetical protein